ncbi:MAG: SUF system Fe-S cluster assembly protein [Sphingomonadales bacterium]|jgi:FeS assembly SUF system protein
MTNNSEKKITPNLNEGVRPKRPMAESGLVQEKDNSFLEGFLKPSEEVTQLGLATKKDLEFKIVDALQSIFDPEIPVNIYELGLIYNIEVADGSSIKVVMTLTTPNCPVAETMPGLVQTTVEEVDGVTSVIVDLVWEPPWDPSMMSEAAQLELGFL